MGRRELDHWLLRAAEREGIEVRQGEAVTAVEMGHGKGRSGLEAGQGSGWSGFEAGAGGVRVETSRGAYRARVLLGADGSRGAVRRRLGWAAGERQARLLEVLTPERPVGGDGPGGWRGTAVFDFKPMTAGVRGYYWDFPSLVDGRPLMNRGIFDSRVGAMARSAGGSLRDLLAEAMARRGRRLDDFPLEGHPIAWFDRGARVSGPPRKASPRRRLASSALAPPRPPRLRPGVFPVTSPRLERLRALSPEELRAGS